MVCAACSAGTDYRGSRSLINHVARSPKIQVRAGAPKYTSRSSSLFVNQIPIQTLFYSQFFVREQAFLVHGERTLPVPAPH